MFVASRTGRQRRPVSSQLVLTSLRQSRSEVNRWKPGNASGAVITANEPGGPAAGIVTVTSRDHFTERATDHPQADRGRWQSR